MVNVRWKRWLLVLMVADIACTQEATTSNTAPEASANDNATAAQGVNFKQCIERFCNSADSIDGCLDSYGQQVKNASKANALSYEQCRNQCGTGNEDFDWSSFSQQFTSWLLPWLALISQLPFGANDRIDNIVAVILAVGSPTLAVYSLTLTALNGRWIANYLYPFHRRRIAYKVVRVLSSLQQAPLRISRDLNLVEGLFTLPDNRRWWGELLSWLNITHTWTVSAAASILWVTIAYLFTVVDSLTDSGITIAVNSNGEAVGAIWLWLVPVVVGWLQLSPKCDSKHVYDALERANSMAWVPTTTGLRIAEDESEHGIRLESDPTPLRHDESSFPPIYNYSRVFSWTQTVEEVAEIFRSIERPRNSPLFSPQPSGFNAESLYETDDHGMQLHSRLPSGASSSAAVTTSLLNLTTRKSSWGSGVWKRIFIASCAALLVQWGCAGSAVFVVWFTPTSGLGCRSASYIFYGVMATLIWFVLLLSSILSHYVVISEQTPFGRSSFSTRFASKLSIFLRRLGKVAALVNALSLIVICLFQFANLFDNCWCNSSVMSQGQESWNIIVFTGTDKAHMRRLWILGVFLAAATTIFYYLFICLLVNPVFPSPDHED